MIVRVKRNPKSIKWTKECECKYCSSELTIEEKDITLRSIGYPITAKCKVCGYDLTVASRLSSTYYGLKKMAMENYRTKFSISQ